MSFLPIILIIIFLLSKNGKGIPDLTGFDFESIAPLLNLFGISNDLLKTLTSDEIKKITSGNFDMKSILPLVTSLIETFKSSSTKPFAETPNSTHTPEYLNPIKDVASDEILSSLGNFFN